MLTILSFSPASYPARGSWRYVIYLAWR